MSNTYACGKNISTVGSYEPCGQPAKYLYNHNAEICAYCDTHNYQCGEKIEWDNLVETAKELERFHSVDGIQEVLSLMAEQAKLND